MELHSLLQPSYRHKQKQITTFKMEDNAYLGTITHNAYIIQETVNIKGRIEVQQARTATI